MKQQQTLKSCIALLACLSLAPAVLSCVEKETTHIEGVHAYIVKASPLVGDYGSAANPLEFPTAFETNGACPAGEKCYNVSVGAYAVDVEGNFLPDYNEIVPISTVPGKLSVDTVEFKNGVVGQWEYDETGKPTKLISGQTIGMRYTFGNTRIWIEDTIEKLKDEMPDKKCLNGREKQDQRTCEPSLATGVSEEFVFVPQTIRMIQYNPEQLDGQSPINKEYAQLKAMKGHELVVTNVVATGFYVTDLGDPEYNSLFIFTYSQPGRVDIGDRVCEVSGGIAEYTGMTQLQFPSWGIQNKERSTAEDIDPAPEDGEQGVGSCIDKETGEVRDCTQEELEAMDAIVDCSNVYYDYQLSKEEKKKFAYIEPPSPRTITPELLALKSDSSKKTGIDGSTIKTSPVQTNALERLEGSVVTIQNVRLSTEFINCDDNGNSKIESGSEEAECRTKCNDNSKRCTEMSNLESYDQWKAWTVDGNAEISVASSSLIANFDITKDCESWIDPSTYRHMMRCPDRRLKRLTGNLKQVLPGCSGDVFCYASKWKSSMIMSVIEPRISTDLIMDEVYNANAIREFKECWNDTQAGGCKDTCMSYGAACTCADFAKYRALYPPSDKTKPVACDSTAQADFSKCWNDTQTGGCYDVCTSDGSICTCEKFTNYRYSYPPLNSETPMACKPTV